MFEIKGDTQGKPEEPFWCGDKSRNAECNFRGET